MSETIHDFLIALSSRAPTPGGGGASALIGAIGASLGSMVANLTSGKKKYAAFQPDIERILGSDCPDGSGTGSPAAAAG